MQIPELLPASVIRRILAHAEARKTYRHGTPKKNRFQFSGMVFCGYCGYLLFGQSNKDGRLYYRHSKKDRRRECPKKPRPCVRADRLEEIVIRHRFEAFGNPEAAKRAVEQAIPDREKAEEYRKRLGELDDKTAKIAKSRKRILKAIEDDIVSQSDAESNLCDLKSREIAVQAERVRLDEALSNSPAPDEIRKMMEKIQRRLERRLPARPLSADRYTGLRNARTNFTAMSWDEKRALAEFVFDGKTAEGQPWGIYVTAIDGEEVRRQKQWRYEVRGKSPIDGDIASRLILQARKARL